MRRYSLVALVGIAIGFANACGSVSNTSDGGTGGSSSGGHGGGSGGGPGGENGTGGTAAGGHGGGASGGAVGTGGGSAGSGGGSGGAAGGASGHLCGPDATCSRCTTGACCGTGCCASGEWCDTTASTPTCRCNAGAACGTGEYCSSPVGGGPVCGLRCCGGDAGTCPISRRIYKRDIETLDDDALKHVSEELRKIKLTTYQYKDEPVAAPRRLGFIIDDTKSSYPINADGNSVNLYGYVSMAVAAIQIQSHEIEALRAEVARLRRARAK